MSRSCSACDPPLGPGCSRHPGAALNSEAGNQVLVLNLPCLLCNFGKSLCPYVQGRGLDLLFPRSPLEISE